MENLSFIDSNASSRSNQIKYNVQLLRASIRAPQGVLHVSRRHIYFVMKVSTGKHYRIVERTWTSFVQFKQTLLTILNPGHECNGICYALVKSLRCNFAKPIKQASFRTKCNIRLHHHTDKAIALFLNHFQQLLDALIVLLSHESFNCQKMDDVYQVLDDFLSDDPM
ncbi:hypothetical protein THRCLA_20730 [Thraustotheca clavata]|uniref:PX domain-containing protein n=1 Tax=Thraustotheca clavata TaxID=74557 RepID=A0A1W0A444_9STRA|nr:hypothetical protein THRCLA_20730 [Thraustotheca clavata]